MQTTRQEDSMVYHGVPAIVENAEYEYQEHRDIADSAPHLWGEDEEAALARLATRLRELYERYNVPKFDRIVL